jgi:hypothetical protein
VAKDVPFTEREISTHTLQFETPGLQYVSSEGDMKRTRYTPVKNGLATPEDGDKAFKPVCTICREFVPLEEAKTDGDGKPVHEECYVRGIIETRNQDNTSGNA